METSGVSAGSSAASFQGLVAAKAMDQQRVEGEQSLKLIESAEAPLATEGSVGTNLHVIG
jgi:hypothetical protein